MAPCFSCPHPHPFLHSPPVNINNFFFLSWKADLYGHTIQRNRQRRDTGGALLKCLALVPSFYTLRYTRPTTCCYTRVCTWWEWERKNRKWWEEWAPPIAFYSFFAERREIRVRVGERKKFLFGTMIQLVLPPHTDRWATIHSLKNWFIWEKMRTIAALPFFNQNNGKLLWKWK